MVDRSKLYDNERSPKRKEQQEARKGDVKKGKDLPLRMDEDDDTEYESLGSTGLSKDDPDAIDPKERAKAKNRRFSVPDKGEGLEIWVPKKKEDVPTS